MRKTLRWPAAAAFVIAIGLSLAVLIAGSAGGHPAEAQSPSATPSPEPPPATTPAPTAPTESTPVDDATPAPSQAVLVEGLVGSIRKLNPLLATYNPVDRDITSLIFEGLTATNAYGEIVPDLAQGWTISPDALTYIVELRQDVLWHDGVPLTAEDVAFTMQLLSAPGFQGAAELRAFWKTVEVDVLDTYLVRFRLTQPLASFLDQLQIGIVPKHVLHGVDAALLGQHPFNLDPIGTGPYQFEALTAANGQIDGVQLRLAPVYRQRPDGATGYAIEQIAFRTYPTAEAALDAYRANEVNSVGVIPPEERARAQQIAGLSLYTGIAPQVGVVIYNWQRDSVGFVRNPRVRLALAYAVDRAALVAEHLGGSAVLANSPLLPNSWAYDPSEPWPAPDLERAQQLMETAGDVFEPPAEDEGAATEEAPAAEEGAGAPEGVPEGEPAATEAAPEAATEEPAEAAPAIPQRAMTILTANDPALVALTEDIAAAWSQLGFDADVQPVDDETLQARLEAGDFDMALVELSFEPYADPDPYVFWHQGQYQIGQNYGGMDDRRISEALENARREPVGVNRLYYYRRFQELFAQRVPALVLYNPLYVYAVDDRVQDVQLGFLSSPSDRFRNIGEWTFAP